MKRLAIIQITLLLSFLPYSHIYAEDYQYQYFNEKKEHTPFSDYIPRVRLHYKTVPHYFEDYYELYGKKQYYNGNSLRKNIERLKTALKCKFRHPSEAIVKVKTEEEYRKYRNLMFMHINILIMRNYLKIASRYDKRRIYFYNLDFAKEIKESLNMAKGLYKEAVTYWNNARRYAESASKIRITTNLGFIESERYSIVNGELDYEKIINNHLNRIKEKRQILNTGLSSINK